MPARAQGVGALAGPMRRLCGAQIRPRGRGLALAASVLLWGLMSSSVASAEEAGAALEGRYVYAGGVAERRRLADAIEAVVGQMSILVRGIARSRLTERVIIAPTVVFRRSGDGLVLDQDPLPSRWVRAEALTVRLTSRFGERVTVTTQLEGDTALEEIRFQGSRQVSRYAPGTAGQRLVMRVDIRSPFLPVPLRYGLTYARRGG